MASYLATVGISELELQTRQGPGGLPIRNYFEHGIDPDRLAVFERQGEMLATFSELFGPYPFDVYGALVLDTARRIAFEAQTLSVFARHRFSSADVSGNEAVVAHELAHQWFGDSVSIADFRDIWLNEGFATYAEALWLERSRGRSLRRWFMENYSETQRNAAGLTPPGSPAPTDLFGRGAYIRGALALHVLRLELGDEAFFSTLRTYTARFANANATTRDFENVAEEVSGLSLSDFFAAWLYGREVPALPEGLFE
jgi:aminopeptidase N